MTFPGIAVRHTDRAFKMMSLPCPWIVTEPWPIGYDFVNLAMKNEKPMRPQNPVILIPARMASSRLPGKPLADIHGKAMIVHVAERAREAGIGAVHVACAEEEIAETVRQAGFSAILTRPDHPSGSDRLAEALTAIDPAGEHDAVVNLQGDLPLIDPDCIRRALDPLADPAIDIATLACPIRDAAEAEDPNVVKAVIALPEGEDSGRALWFSRAPAPYGDGPRYHHIGIYAYRPSALARFVALPPSPLERRERLEQLRALEAGMQIGIALVDSFPLGVDTPADLEAVRSRVARN